MNMIEVKNLFVTFKTKRHAIRAVRDLSFTIAEGETVGIVGESGCGKSTVAKSLLKLLPASCQLEGEILFQGQNLVELSEKQMQKVRGKEIGMIFQDPMTSLNPTMKIGKQVAEGYARHHPDVSSKEALAYAESLLELVGIPQAKERIDAYPHTLSGGMRQRVMIALALAPKPKLIVADEPTTALDVTIQAQILDLLKEIQQKTGTSILLITHDLSVVAGMCDRVLVMYGGKIVEKAGVEELFSHPRHPYTQRLIQSKPRLDLLQDHPLLPIEGTPPDLSCPPLGCSFCTRCPSALQICAQEEPDFFAVSGSHKSRCWLHDPRASHE